MSSLDNVLRAMNFFNYPWHTFYTITQELQNSEIYQLNVLSMWHVGLQLVCKPTCSWNLCWKFNRAGAPGGLVMNVSIEQFDASCSRIQNICVLFILWIIILIKKKCLCSMNFLTSSYYITLKCLQFSYSWYF
jgi:hypothetical protein